MSKTKLEYRVWAKTARKNFDKTQKSFLICEKIKRMDEYTKATKIAAFYPFDNEIDIKNLFSDLTKNWYLPVITDEKNMIFRKFHPETPLNLNKYNILEPACTEELNINELDLIIIPALLVDESGYRLGYGKGYYDRFLAKLPATCVKLVPIYKELLVKSIPVDEFDVPVDIAVTEAGIYHYK